MRNLRQLGARQEELAVAYLENQGYTILERNYNCRRGEIDLIARDEGCIVFVEVKYRTNEKTGNPLDAVNYAKQQRIIYSSKHYLMMNHIPEDHACRYDVIAILGDEITHIKDAFWM